jgi:hypothetical protein
VLYSVEAAARRARERSCAGVLGSIGLAKGLGPRPDQTSVAGGAA